MTDRRRARRSAVVLAALVLVAAGTVAWVLLRGGPEHRLTRPADLDAVTSAIADAVPDAQADADVPGVAVAVVEDGRVVWQRGFGVPEDTVFQAGSISKPVAAAAVLALVDAGRLDLDTPVSAYLRSWRLPADSPDPDGVTLRTLLSHTAGIDTAGYQGLDRGTPLPTTAQSLADVHQTEDAGHYRYSGGGYTIAQQVVEDVTGESFATVVQREVLDPLGMASSGYACTTATKGHGYAYAEAAAAGLCSSAADLGRFAAWLDSDDPRAEAMRTPQAATGGDYGLGLELDQLPTVRHEGVNRGYHAELLADPGKAVGLVVLTDGDRGGDVVDAVLDAWHSAD
ncbi:beta-lactamase family protein [Nocardioides anomalus]|uniref:Beta-lactamase family protein n=1 Tax=Nocardioides anomalus TaxID=2712223 RepID=A0A6G6WI94_9ACTN|nr:serine hydrolase domain-containing protein [Nocardioides anomalus]QIG44887.1 beta-lactamase family protein [Nocardioides anomalus]